MDNKVYLKDIVEFLGDKIIEIKGHIGNKYIEHLRPVEATDETTLDWINPNKQNRQQIAEYSKAQCIICDNGVEYTKVLSDQEKILVYVNNPKRIIAELAYEYFVEKKVASIHSTAIIDPRADIGKNVYIGANSVIGNCTIGDNCMIESNCVINSCVIVGADCYFKSGVVLGGDGFGFEKNDNGQPVRFPQLGKVIIGSNVEIGSNSCIDRGSLSDTTIGNFVKINNLCHIAHNNKIGDRTIITNGVIISGSNIIGEDVWIAPNASIKGWLNIEAYAFIGMGAVVTKNVPTGETWVGNPAKKLR